jgi:hypothetical protein
MCHACENRPGHKVASFEGIGQSNTSKSIGHEWWWGGGGTSVNGKKHGVTGGDGPHPQRTRTHSELHSRFRTYNAICAWQQVTISVVPMQACHLQVPIQWYINFSTSPLHMLSPRVYTPPHRRSLPAPTYRDVTHASLCDSVQHPTK